MGGVAKGKPKVTDCKSSSGVSESGHEMVVIGPAEVSFEHLMLVGDLKDGCKAPGVLRESRD